jgi:hypothetical protein
MIKMKILNTNIRAIQNRSPREERCEIVVAAKRKEKKNICKNN